ncbi:hypothetical protein [Xenorhabdus stockiae]
MCTVAGGYVVAWYSPDKNNGEHLTQWEIRSPLGDWPVGHHE